jgi:putative phosphoserine phosphatase/1-acylglycerol-3-phosphate O-acyltransferase
VAIATTTPLDMVEPLAHLLGIDEVIATRYGVRGGAYDGTIDGHFVWGRGKLAAVREWAARREIDLDESYAYTDSYYDAGLLGAVGHPVVVNPDPRLRVLAVARRWPTVFLDVPPGVPKLAGIEPQQVAFPFARPGFLPFVDFHIEGTEQIPSEGPAILCGNHRSYFDFAAVAMAIGKRGRPNRFLAKKELFDVPVFGDIFRALGGIRVDRGTGKASPLHEAAAALEAGQLVTIMPQGTIPRGRAFFDPVLKGRSGAARLAKMTGAPIVPMGIWGTEQVWPRNARVPNVLSVIDRPVVSVTVGAPFELDHVNLRTDTERIMAAIVDLLPDEAREWHEPTDDELARALPPDARGDAGDLDHERERRPGTD